MSTCLDLEHGRRPHRGQRGDILLESLIGVLLMGIIASGMVYITSRVSVTAKDLRVSSIAVAQMRNLLQRYGPALCAGGDDHDKSRITMPDGSTHKLKVVCTTPAAVTMGGLTVKPPAAVALCTSTRDKALFSNPIMVGDSKAGTCTGTD